MHWFGEVVGSHFLVTLSVCRWSLSTSDWFWLCFNSFFRTTAERSGNLVIVDFQVLSTISYLGPHSSGAPHLYNGWSVSYCAQPLPYSSNHHIILGVPCHKYFKHYCVLTDFAMKSSAHQTLEFFLNVFNEYTEFSDKNYLSLKLLKPATSSVRDQVNFACFELYQ